MVEVKVNVPDWEPYSTEHYLSVRVGDVQKLSRISAHRTFRIPASAVGTRRYAKVEVFRRVGSGSLCIDTKVANTSNEASVHFEGKELQYNVTVNPLKGDVKAAVPVDERTPEEKSNPKLMDAKDYLERYHMEARLSEAMQALLRVRPPDPALFLAEQLATNAGVVEKLPRKQDSVKEELERLHGLFPCCSLDGGATSSSKDLYPRAWVKAPPAASTADGLRLHVAQFNVLADGLSGMSEHRGGFTESPPESLAWRYRRGRLVEELFRHGVAPDVVTMQEVDHFFDWFQPVMEGLGYEGRFLAKPNSNCRKSLDKSLEDGCALFWRRKALSLRHLDTLTYGAVGGQPSNQVALVAELRPLDGTHPFVLATSHLSAKKTHEVEQVRAAQAVELLDRLRSRGLPCVLGLDMNAAPERNPSADYDSEAYATVMSHPVRLRSAYALALGAEPGYTTWKRRGDKEARHTIDYILTSGNIAVERVLAPPAEEDMAPERLPGWRYPSDHVALLAELRLPKALLSAPFSSYAQQHMPGFKPEAFASMYSKFPANHSASAAAAAKEVRNNPPLHPFAKYYRSYVTSIAADVLPTVHSRFPAARRALELRVSGPEVLSATMPHFGIYYSKHVLPAGGSALERFHMRVRQRAAEEAAKKKPAPLHELSFFLYYRRHMIPTSSSSLSSLYGKFRRKPQPKPRRKPEPLVSLSYFLYYNRYLLPSSTVSLHDIHRKFGRGHLEPKALAPPSSPLAQAGGRAFHAGSPQAASAALPRVAPGDVALASGAPSTVTPASATEVPEEPPPWSPPEDEEAPPEALGKAAPPPLEDEEPLEAPAERHAQEDGSQRPTDIESLRDAACKSLVAGVESGKLAGIMAARKKDGAQPPKDVESLRQAACESLVAGVESGKLAGIMAARKKGRSSPAAAYDPPPPAPAEEEQPAPGAEAPEAQPRDLVEDWEQGPPWSPAEGSNEAPVPPPALEPTPFAPAEPEKEAEEAPEGQPRDPVEDWEQGPPWSPAEGSNEAPVPPPALEPTPFAPAEPETEAEEGLAELSPPQDDDEEEPPAPPPERAAEAQQPPPWAPEEEEDSATAEALKALEEEQRPSAEEEEPQWSPAEDLEQALAEESAPPAVPPPPWSPAEEEEEADPARDEALKALEEQAQPPAEDEEPPFSPAEGLDEARTAPAALLEPVPPAPLEAEAVPEAEALAEPAEDLADDGELPFSPAEGLDEACTGPAVPWEPTPPAPPEAEAAVEERSLPPAEGDEPQSAPAEGQATVVAEVEAEAEAEVEAEPEAEELAPPVLPAERAEPAEPADAADAADAAEPVKAAPPRQPAQPFEFRLEPRESAFGPYFSEHVLQPYGPSEGFATLHALFAASPPE